MASAALTPEICTIFARVLLASALALAAPAAFAGDDVLAAIDQARKSYEAGNMTAAKQSLDLASQLVGQKNAESFAEMLPPPLSGATAEKVACPADLAAALARAAAAPISTVVVIETDPVSTTEAGGHWWDVAVAEVSTRTDVQAARSRYDDSRKGQVK